MSGRRKLGPELEVARWEFRRFAKTKDLLVGVVIFAVLFGIGGGFGRLVSGARDKVRDVGVVGIEHLGPGVGEELERARLVVEDRSLEEWEGALETGEIEALLVMRDPDHGELRVTETRSWQQALLGELDTRRRAQRLVESGIDRVVLERVAAPLRLELVRIGGNGGKPATRGDLLAAGLVVAAMLAALFIGFSYVFVAITGEKTQRVTESILSAITAQQWVDGKILGLTAVVLVNLLSWVAGYLIYRGFDALFLGGDGQLSIAFGHPATLPWLVLFGVSGFAFWFTFFAMAASTISDPNSSSRSALMFLPFLPLSLAFAGLDDPDSTWMRALSWIPGFSPTAMPVRLLRGEPTTWELVVALGAMISMVWVFRRAAGRVFGVSMLMTGKEPSLRELWHWVRAPQA